MLHNGAIAPVPGCAHVRGAHRRPEITVESTIPDAAELRGLREENRTLYGVIKLVSSSAALEPMLQGVVDLATEATGCHACFIYLLKDGQLTIRAASPVFGEAVATCASPCMRGSPVGWRAIELLSSSATRRWTIRG